MVETTSKTTYFMFLFLLGCGILMVLAFSASKSVVPSFVSVRAGANEFVESSIKGDLTHKLPLVLGHSDSQSAVPSFVSMGGANEFVESSMKGDLTHKLPMVLGFSASKSAVPSLVSVGGANEFVEISMKGDLTHEPTGCVKYLADILNLFKSNTFLFITVVYIFSMSFLISFLNFVGEIAVDAGASATSVGVIFGIINACGRLLVSVGSDYTCRHPLGGHTTYMVLSLLTFGLGLFVIAVAEDVGPPTIHFVNAAAALGYGGLSGITPPLLRLEFGVEKLGFLYGFLWSAVGLSEPFWSRLVEIGTGTCEGLDCFRTFLFAGFGTMVLTALIGCLTIMHSCTEIKSNLDARSLCSQ